MTRNAVACGRLINAALMLRPAPVTARASRLAGLVLTGVMVGFAGVPAARAAPLTFYPLPAGQQLETQSGQGTLLALDQNQLALYDAQLWFGETTGLGSITASGSITSHSVDGDAVYGVEAGPSLGLWFGAIDQSGTAAALGSLTGGGLSWYGASNPYVPDDVGGMTVGPDGQLWASGDSSGIGPAGSSCAEGWSYIYSFDGNGETGDFPVCGGSGNEAPWIGTADGLVWFTTCTDCDTLGGYTIDSIDETGQVTSYPAPAGLEPVEFGAGPDGALWVLELDPTDTARNAIVRVVPGGEDTIFWIGGAPPPTGFVSADGSLWITFPDHVLRLAPTGAALSYPTASGTLDPGNPLDLTQLAVGPDGALWSEATDDPNGGNAIASGIARLDPAASPASCSRATIDKQPSGGGTLLATPYVPPADRPAAQFKQEAQLASGLMTEADLLGWTVKFADLAVPDDPIDLAELVGLSDFVDPNDALSSADEHLIDEIAADPPDPNFRQLWHLHVPTLPRISARHLAGPVRRSVTTLINNEAQTAAVGLAYIHSVERAEAAAAAGNEHWVGKQDQSAASAEAKLVRLLAAQPGDRAALYGHLARWKLAHVTVSERALLRARERLERRGLPSSARTLLRRFGFTNSDLESMAQQLATAPVTPQPLLDSVSTPALSGTLHATAQASQTDLNMAACAG